MKLINNNPPFKTMSESARRRVLENINLILVAIIWVVLFTVLFTYAPKNGHTLFSPDLPMTTHSAKFF